jgi:putative glycosyltransferase (TIGR04348 family)
VRILQNVLYDDGMKIFMVCPAPPHSRKGNRVTAERWATLLDQLGHHVKIGGNWQGEPCDVLLALHARKSFSAVRRYRQAHPQGALIIALTGTDLYRDLQRGQQAQQSIRWADRLIGLHGAVDRDLPTDSRGKLRVILQSVAPISPRPARSEKTFTLCVLGHLRYEKDPLRAALALRRLPEHKQLRLIQVGQALQPRYAKWAQAAMRHDPRYRWIGEVARGRALRLLASSRLMVISSRMEGGANVVGEAIVHGVPILASNIAGNVGLLGADYPGYFSIGDTKALAGLLERACTDRRFYQALQQGITRLAPRFEPRREQAGLSALLQELQS